LHVSAHNSTPRAPPRAHKLYIHVSHLQEAIAEDWERKAYVGVVKSTVTPLSHFHHLGDFSPPSHPRPAMTLPGADLWPPRGSRRCVFDCYWLSHIIKPLGPIDSNPIGAPSTSRRPENA